MNAIALETPLAKLGAAGILFTLTLLSGLWVSNSGKPYNSFIFGIHKIIAVVTVVLLGIEVVNLFKTIDTRTFSMITAVGAAALLMLALIVSGSLLSLDITLSGISLKVHQVAPLLALVASAASLYLLARA